MRTDERGEAKISLFGFLRTRLYLIKKDHTETRFEGVNRKEADEDKSGDKSRDLALHVGTSDVRSH
jgi:hypothetical protein